MQVIIAIICVFGAAAAIIFLSFLDMNGVVGGRDYRSGGAHCCIQHGQNTTQRINIGKRYREIVCCRNLRTLFCLVRHSVFLRRNLYLC